MPIPIKVEDKLSNVIVMKGNYKELNEIQIEKIKNYIKNKKGLTIESVLSMRSAYMNMKIMKRNFKLLRNIKYLTKLYKKKFTIKEICKKMDFSPISILRNIFNYLGYSKNEVKNFLLLRNLDKLSDFDIEQINYSIKNDIFNKIDQSDQLNNSKQFELKIEKFLKDNSVQFKTQEELADEQIKKFGKSINTPDFLITSDLYINGNKINWIDAKNFYGANTDLVRKKTKKQIAKYIDKYGFGSIIFSLNFSESLKFDNVLLIDYMSLKLL